MREHTTLLTINLESVVQNAPPGRKASNLLSVGVDLVPVQLTAAGIDIDLGGLQPTSALPGITDNPEENDDEEGQEAVEETLGGVQAG